jgi:hypothetical protein
MPDIAVKLLQCMDQAGMMPGKKAGTKPEK